MNNLNRRISQLEQVSGPKKPQLIIYHEPPETEYHAGGGQVYQADDLPGLREKYDLVTLRIVRSRK